MRNILVTGGAGYIGSHTCHILKKHGYRTIVVDDLSRGHIHNVPEAELRRFSLLETGRLARLLKDEQVDAVIHFAAFIAVGESAIEPERYLTNNVAGSLSLFAAMAEARVRHLVFSSTAAVYGIPENVPIGETAPIQPISPYGESKVMVERALKTLDEFRGLRSVALRYFNACGAEPGSGLGEEHDPETHLIPLLIRAVRTGKPITVFGDDYPTPDGTCIRDYIHVSDLAEAHVLALDYLLNGGSSTALNVGTGRGHSVREVMAAVEQVSGQKVPFRVGERRPGDPPSLVADSSRLQNQLGWKPRYTRLVDIVRTAWEFQPREGQ